MSLRSRVVRTTLTSATGLVLAGASLIALPGTAHAVAVSNTSHQALRQVNEQGPASCTVSNPSVNDTNTFTSNGATFTRTASASSLITDTGDNTDTTTVNSSTVSALRAKEAGGQLASLHLDAKIATTMTSAQGLGTDCDPQVLGAAIASYETVLTTARWVTVDGFLPGSGTATFIFNRMFPASPGVSEIFVLQGTQKGKAHLEFFLPAGTYGTSTTITNTFNSPQSASEPTSQTVTPSIDITFSAPGSAIDKSAGDGTKYAKFNNATDCATKQLKGKFLKAAGTKAKPALKKAIFKVNGKKSKVVKGAKAIQGGKIALKNLPASDNIELKATFKLVGGGSATLTRTYRSCG